MKRIVLSADNFPSIYLVPDEVAVNLNHYVNRFHKWLFNPENDHGYWMELPQGGKCVCYTETAFIQWLDDHVLLSSGKAELVEAKSNHILSEDEQKYPKYNF